MPSVRIGRLAFNSAESHRRGARGVAGESNHVGFYLRRITARIPLGLSDPIIASLSWFSPSSAHIQSISVWLHLRGDEDVIPDPKKISALPPACHSPKQNPTESIFPIRNSDKTSSKGVSCQVDIKHETNKCYQAITQKCKRFLVTLLIFIFFMILI